jgi:hypothetical protein
MTGMQRYIAVLLLLNISLFSQGQVTISGRVTGVRNKPLEGASVTLKDTYDGAVTDSAGFYSFTTSEKGSTILEFSALNYNKYERPLTLSGTSVVINAALKEELNELNAVTVTAGSFEASDRKRASVVLNSIDVATTAGANADITSAMRTLPGAQQIGDQEGLFVRGGAGYETKQFIDGTTVNNPFFTSIPDIATRGRFSPFLFKGTVFSTGGYSALYGGALSSALILESIDLPDNSAGNASVSPILTGIGYQHLNKKKNASWGLNYGFVSLAAYFSVVEQKPDYFKLPTFHNGDFNFRIRTKSGGMLKYYSTFNYGGLGLRRPDIDSSSLKNAFSLTNYNWYNNLSWRENLGKGWKMNLGFAFSTNKDLLSQEVQDSLNNKAPTPFQPWITGKNFNFNIVQNFAQGRAVFEKRLRALSAIRFGAEHIYTGVPGTYTQFDTSIRQVLKDNYSATFAEADIYISSNLALKAGMRYEYSSIIDAMNLAPRISLAYKLAKNEQISVAYGQFYQKPENQQLGFSTTLGFTKATHYIANYQKTSNDRIFRAEIFYKEYDALVKTAPLFDNSGSGYANGIEFFWRDKKTIKNLDYWISYSYLDTKRDFLNFPEKLTPNFAAKHTANLVIKRFVTEWKTGFNMTYSYATGRPYYFFQQDLATGKYEVADQGTTKDFHNAGFSLNYLPNLGKQNAKMFWVLVASVTNVFGAKPVFNYNYSYDGLMKQPVGLPAPRFYFIGCFLSWGIDRSQDAINNNL